ncbi:MAG: alpha/beta hydrolase [Verrucomicrobia bacterium]|nr:MAG: alpha/beta hydrolase [Verrucomicrobiota bacterium]
MNTWLRIKTYTICGLIILAAIAAILVVFQPSLIYFPRTYQKDVEQESIELFNLKRIEVTTSQGIQTAYLQGDLNQPYRMWIVCGGNGSVALDWCQWISSHGPKDVAWLVIDYPGYGASQGKPSPKTIRESIQLLVPQAAKTVKWRDRSDYARLRFIGHSLGGAACLTAASDFGIRKGILIAPFTSTMDMSEQMLGVPLDWLVWHRFDNRARIKELSAEKQGQILIFHGKDDNIIPVEMSRTLARDGYPITKLWEIEHASHNDILELNAQMIAAAVKHLSY